MNAIKIFFLLLFFTGAGNAQVNLVPNPSFEDTVNCPVNISGMFGEQIYALANWFPAASSPDYFNPCATNQASNPLNGFGFQVPQSGDGYIGFYTILQSPINQNVREIVGVQLLQNLIVGTKYYFKANISAGYGGLQVARYFSNNIGVHFSNSFFEAQQNPFTINNNPIGNYDSILMDTTNWVPFQFSFIADSSYMYLYVGNFYNDINTDSILPYGFTGATGAYYYMDNLCLSTDSNFCETLTGFQSIDYNEIHIWPNPIQNYFQFSAKESIDVVTIYDSRGKLILSENVNALEGRIDFDVLSEGIYFAVFRRESDVSVQKFLKF